MFNEYVPQMLLLSHLAETHMLTIFLTSDFRFLTAC